MNDPITIKVYVPMHLHDTLWRRAIANGYFGATRTHREQVAAIQWLAQKRLVAFITCSEMDELISGLEIATASSC